MSRPAQKRLSTALASTTARTASSAAACSSAAIRRRTIANPSALTGGRASRITAIAPQTSYSMNLSELSAVIARNHSVRPLGGADSFAAAVLWRKRQKPDPPPACGNKTGSGNFPIMMLAITGQWVAEVTTVLCLFGAACIALAMLAGEGGGGAPRQVEQKSV